MDTTYLEYQVPFCPPFNCSAKAFNGTSTTLWTCLPQDCRNSMFVLLAFTAMLGVMTISCNWVILGINLASKTRRMRKRNPTMSNYSVYVFSLAVADLLVGILVLPLCLFNFYAEFILNGIILKNSSSNSELETATSMNSSSSDASELSGEISFPVNSSASNSSQENLYARMDSTSVMSDILGVVTHLTIFVSIYTLIAASADRLYAATYSTRNAYSQIVKRVSHRKNASWLVRSWRSTRRSTIAVGLVWLLGAFFAVAPLILNSQLHFRSIGHMFVAMTSESAYSAIIHWYLVTLIFPLVGIWLLNFVICFTLWRRKCQLGFQRRRSLRRDHPPETGSKIPCPNTASDNDDVFSNIVNDRAKVQKYPAAHWNQDQIPLQDRPKKSSRRIYRSKSSRESDSCEATASPIPRYSQPQIHDSKGSILRRKVSSIRRAKEMMQRQSSESNITKTLCMVVVAFTVAVLPLVIALARITTGENSSPERLNREVSALTVSILFLFSNSVVNCVIYGARMRDFRTILCAYIRAFVDKLKNIFCWCCLDSRESFSSEVVSGVFLVTSSKHQKADAHPKSPRFGSGTLEKLRRFTKASSKKSVNLDARQDTVDSSNKESYETPAPMRKTFYPLNNIDKIDHKNARPSSSGYRTDPEPLSLHDEKGTRRYSQRSDFEETAKEDQPKQESFMRFQHVQLRHQKRPASVAVTSDQNTRSKLSLPIGVNNPEDITRGARRRTLEIQSSLDEARKISVGAAKDYTKLFDYMNKRDSRIVSPTDVDINKLQFPPR